MTGPIIKKILFTGCFFFISLYASAQGPRKMIKSLEGKWNIRISIQYGDTLFDLAHLDTVAMARQQMDYLKQAYQYEKVPESDSLVILQNIKSILNTTGKFFLDFRKDSVYFTGNYQGGENIEGRYWLNEEGTILYLNEVDRSAKVGTWAFSMMPDNKEFVMELKYERTGFVMRKEED